MKKKIIIPFLAGVVLLTTVGFTTTVKSDFFEIAKQLEIFTTLYKELNMNYVDEVTPATLMDNAIKGVLADLDPYTVYWNEQAVEDARIKNSGVYTGIGATVRNAKDKLIIVEPFKGYPADKAGLKAGDEIIKVGNTAIDGYEDEPLDLLKGNQGSKVEVTFNRQGKTQKVSIERDAVEVNAVPYYKLINEDIGYIVLSKFNKKTTKETQSALENLKLQGAKKIVLDLRGNPGGLLNEAINIVNLFVPKGEVVTTTQSVIEKYNKVYKTTKEPVDTEIPLVVLVNGRSASASEIVSGGLQDLDRAVIVGARSFGKGLVQRPKKLTYGTQLKVTISRYYTPSGRCIQALDYWNRDENGDPVRVDSKEYNAFKTKGGRTVYDGGGVLPDIELETAVFSPITTALLKDNAIFDYATEFYYKNNSIDPATFEFTDAEFNKFLAFLKQKNFKYETDTEKKFEEALRNAEDDDIKNEISNAYNALMTQIAAAKEQKLIKKKVEIKSLLSDEILKRYFYKEGLYDYQIVNNPEILAAIDVLNDEKKYKRILK
ncbi:peptidase S41 [Patiriisocius marinistellae]|uniref:Peptidase S41 n=1 Tax=Patiriisocius marinistellae TaxID=2494560 RepID=A0A5J4FSD0_9FLAO|nr:S41 family peptidase [Patiriisocius marinistellae]GEQ84897.1 peptidase S41 [Patiriisocius marinistellae]